MDQQNNSRNSSCGKKIEYNSSRLFPLLFHGEYDDLKSYLFSLLLAFCTDFQDTAEVNMCTSVKFQITCFFTDYKKEGGN